MGTMAYAPVRQTKSDDWYTRHRMKKESLIDCSRRRTWRCLAEPRVEEYIRRREDVHDKAILICGVEAGRNVAVIEPALEERFREQAEKWDKETAHISSPVQRFSHPSYMAILGMAQDDRDKVIDLLLRDMRDNSREWFWALSYLTHENPVTRKESGRLNKMIDAWVRWGKERGRI